MLFEGAGKVLAAVEAQLVGDFGDAQMRPCQEGDGKFHFQGRIVLIGCDIIDFFEKVQNAGAGKMDMVCDFVNTQRLGQVFFDILLHRKGGLGGTVAGG